MAKNRIQVTTAHVSSDAQIILPNTYFVTKAVKAMLGIDMLRDYIKMMETDSHKDFDPFVKDQVEMANSFLHELIDALEGKDDDE